MGSSTREETEPIRNASIDGVLVEEQPSMRRREAGREITRIGQEQLKVGNHGRNKKHSRTLMDIKKEAPSNKPNGQATPNGLVRPVMVSMVARGIHQAIVQ